MKIEEVVKALENELSKSQGIFFGYAWREKLGELGEFLQEESKYAKLVEWIETEIAQCNEVKDVFCPADKNESTTVSMVQVYKDLMQKLAILVHCKQLLLDGRTTMKMRENIEYTLCKLYDLHYSEELETYI
jgi:hypothetical protein